MFVAPMCCCTILWDHTNVSIKLFISQQVLDSSDVVVQVCLLYYMTDICAWEVMGNPSDLSVSVANNIYTRSAGYQ